MKLFLCAFRLFLLLILSTTLNAQIEITSDDMMQLGDTVRMSFAMDEAIDYQTTGANSTWDFSYLNPETQDLIDPLDPSQGGLLIGLAFGPGAGDHAAEYYRSLDLPLDQVGGFLPVNIEDAFRFSAIDDDSLTFVGISLKVDGNEVGFQSDTIEKVYEFPMQFEDTINSVGFTEADFNPFLNAIFHQHRVRSSIVDGYGEVITPYGTFDALRVHSEIIETDSIYLDMIGGWFQLPIPVSHEYEWWAKDELLPVMKITVQDLPTGETVSEITYRDFYRGLDASTQNFTLLEASIFPNPAESSIEIQAKDPIDKVNIYSSSGVFIESNSFSHINNAEIDISDLSSGVYIVEIVGKGNKIIRQQIIKK